MSAELGARRTAAAAALADYRRESQAHPSAGAAFWAHWSGRLGAALESVLALPVAGLSPAQQSTVLAALDDAATFRTERAAAYCYACSGHPAGACDEHVDDLDQAGAYRQVAREIGGQR